MDLKQTIKTTLVWGGAILTGVFSPIITGDYHSRTFSKPYYQVKEEIKTPEQASRYCMSLRYIDDEYSYGREHWPSLKEVHEKRGDDCDGAALAALSLLEDDGYKPLMLAMGGNKESGHAVFPYNLNGMWGIIGIGEFDNLPPVFYSLKEIMQRYKYTHFKLYAIDTKDPQVFTEKKSLKYSRYMEVVAEYGQYSLVDTNEVYYNKRIDRLLDGSLESEPKKSSGLEELKNSIENMLEDVEESELVQKIKKVGRER